MKELSGISIVIPVFNEAARITSTLMELDAQLPLIGKPYEVIVVDDGSTDRTAETVTAQRTVRNLKLIRLDANRGKGASVKAGIAASSYDLVYQCDADLATPVRELGAFLERIGEGDAVVIGTRYVPEARIVNPQPWYRVCMGRTFNLLARTLVVQGIRDTQCGFKLYRKQAAERIAALSKIERFSFDAEMLFLARKLGLRVGQLPVTWRNDPHSSVRLIADSVLMAVDLFRIRIYDLLGRYTERSGKENGSSGPPGN